MKNRNETFGRLLKAGIASIANCEGKKVAVVEEELGQAISVAADTVQRYKTGFLPPDDNAVKQFAEAAVQRGLLGREWLQRFLHAARYPFAERLLNELCPQTQVQPRPERVYENLPAPIYSQFIMRDQAFVAVLEGLEKRSAAVLLVGLGGNGKTSLAREVAIRCLRESPDAPRFDAAVWVSDKDRPGTTNLSTVLDEIARTLDYPGITLAVHDEKRREVEQLLRRQRVLLIIDNGETITDLALLSWLLNLPEPSKALITSRERHRLLWGTWLVELRGMSDREAYALITLRMRALGLGAIAGDPSHFTPLLLVTGGNPKAIELTLGLIKLEHRPLQQLVDDLHAARGKLFDDLFTRAWALLDEGARRILMGATFFPTSAGAPALGAVADAQGFALDQALERLADLSLLDVQQYDLVSEPRYALHPLVRAFAEAKLREQPGFTTEGRDRWVAWYTELAARVGWCWDNLDRLRLLDPEQENVFVVAAWAFEHQWDERFFALEREISYYYRVRAQWPRLVALHQMRIQAAERQHDATVHVLALSDYVQILSLQGDVDTAESSAQRLAELVEQGDVPQPAVWSSWKSLALYFVAKQEYRRAQQLLEQILEASRPLSAREKVRTQRWLATVLYYLGHTHEAQHLFQDTLREAQQIHSTRVIMAIQVKLAAIHVSQGAFDEGQRLLDASQEIARQYSEYRHGADIHYTYAHLHALRGEYGRARAALTQAIDLYERMGRRRELVEAREALAHLAADPPTPPQIPAYPPNDA